MSKIYSTSNLVFMAGIYGSFTTSGINIVKYKNKCSGNRYVGGLQFTTYIHNPDGKVNYGFNLTSTSRYKLLVQCYNSSGAKVGGTITAIPTQTIYNPEDPDTVWDSGYMWNWNIGPKGDIVPSASARNAVSNVSATAVPGILASYGYSASYGTRYIGGEWFGYRCATDTGARVYQPRIKPASSQLRPSARSGGYKEFSFTFPAGAAYFIATLQSYWGNSLTGQYSFGASNLDEYKLDPNSHVWKKVNGQWVQHDNYRFYKKTNGVWNRIPAYKKSGGWKQLD